MGENNFAIQTEPSDTPVVAKAVRGFQRIAAADIEQTVQNLSLDEKVALLTGKDFWHTVSIPRLGIPSIRLSDGPNGIRGTRFFGSVPSSCLPCGTAIGATFDRDLAVEIGHLLAAEAKAKGAHVVLGPTINIPRGPLGGRGFESFSEDPLLSGIMAGSYCKGLDEKNILATLKHFVCNDQEHERMAVNSIVTDRALREIYLLPFMLAIAIGKPAAIMTAYNKLNGLHVAENPDLLTGILREEWGWDGLLMSDWFATYSTSEAIQAGLDLEMPGPTRWRGSALLHAIASNKVSMSSINARVRAILRLVQKCSKSGVPETAVEGQLNRPEDAMLMRRIAADAIVLLKNEEDILPLDKYKRIAVIGPNAQVASYCGGGSAALNPYTAVSPLEGISNAALGGVDFAQGVYGHQKTPLLGKQLRTPDGHIGFVLRIFNEPPGTNRRILIEERHETDAMVFFFDYNNPNLQPIWYADAEGYFIPEESGSYDFGLCVQGTGNLYVDGKLLINNTDVQTPGPSFLGAGTIEEKGTIELDAGKEYKILVQWGCSRTGNYKAPAVVDFGHGGFRFGACKRISPQEGIEEAVALASQADQVILFAGLNAEWESEGEDRSNMRLPPHSDQLITSVLAVNPKTVVILQSGTPVEMPWIDDAKAVVHAWYGGNETGNGIADVIFGHVNPSGKLPITFPRYLQQNPTYLNYRSEGGRVLYGEDVYVGYRFYDMTDTVPLFPFGHGPSYTSFQLSDMQLLKANGLLTVSCTLRNVGQRSGAEVVQLYVAPPPSSVNRPVKELKEFQKVWLAAGAEKTVTISLDLVRATSYWDEKRNCWCSHHGVYGILVGTCSRGKLLESSVQKDETTFWLNNSQQSIREID